MAKISTAALQALRSSSFPLPLPSLPSHPPLPCSLSLHTGRPYLRLRPRRSQTSARRTYHSCEHDAPPPFPPAENAILSAAIPHVSTQGFTTAALSHGARDVGYVDASINLFPAGAFALVNYHLVAQRLALADYHSTTAKQQAGGGVAEQVEALAWQRLQANKPIVHRWQEALALIALPKNLPTSLHELALLADEILFLAGDTAVDTSWYTRRAALSAIYASSELFMTEDRSEGFSETRAFLGRRLDEARRTGGALEMVGKWVGMQGIGIVNGLRSKGVRI